MRRSALEVTGDARPPPHNEQVHIYRDLRGTSRPRTDGPGPVVRPDGRRKSLRTTRIVTSVRTQSLVSRTGLANWLSVKCRYTVPGPGKGVTLHYFWCPECGQPIRLRPLPSADRHRGRPGEGSRKEEPVTQDPDTTRTMEDLGIHL